MISTLLYLSGDCQYIHPTNCETHWDKILKVNYCLYHFLVDGNVLAKPFTMFVTDCTWIFKKEAQV